ncbi:DUF2163 domain-containing protein [Altererythrobacter sp. ZODW24]|uniref:DUF2163 domain-containing protein n=1 Tax=Altererythrobacter sp. ZODW24 TaxID=2185142 RepID=UPI000DF73902|nr:DUF2163 domain-containing protein [Altererythrobacter sp. ZODW24]
MSRIFFREELEGVATFWRIHRRDGVTLGFTSHDRDLRFDGVLHRAAPGMLPSAIRRTADLGPDSAEIRGALSHDSISADDLAAGRFDGARVQIGAVDWGQLDRTVLYNGSLGGISQDGGGFAAELRSSKADLEADPVPRTSPTCRAQFCGPGCGLSVNRFSTVTQVTAIDQDKGHITFADIDHSKYAAGHLRWIDGPSSGLRTEIMAADASAIAINTAIDDSIGTGLRARLVEGCDHTISTCENRFGNAVNFQGEPYLPGNDLLARYPSTR